MTCSWQDDVISSTIAVGKCISKNVHREGKPLMDERARKLLDRLVPELSSLHKQAAEAYWQATTTGEEQFERQYIELEQKLRQTLADEQLFSELKALKEGGLSDPFVARQIELLYHEALPNQVPQEDIAELVRRTAEIEGIFTRFRASYRGRPISDNEIKDILRTEKDTYKRREAWYASKQIGEEIVDKLIELVKYRNRIAHKLGFRDYFQLMLTAQEIDEDELFAIFDDLKQKTDQPFADIKAEMDKIIAKQYKDLRPEGLRHWHYVDPFFQEAPDVFDVDLDKVFNDQNLEHTAKAFYKAIGLDVTDILARSDLYEREQKQQHAYCTDIDREGDVRILCNLQPNESWMSTLLHELGHAVYDTYHDRELPYLLRQPAHIATTEAIAMMMGRLTKSPAWLTTYAGMDAEKLADMETHLTKQFVLAQLVLLRWCLVMTYFERDLYADPDQDLTERWWHYVETIQYVPCPEGRHKPDWASKIHFTIAPIYYQNYLLGELIASQLWATMEKSVSDNPSELVTKEEIGAFLKKHIFEPGARYHWNDLLEKATGEKLNPDYHVQYFVNRVADLVEQKKKRAPRKRVKK